jgi:hypothetical protein
MPMKDNQKLNYLYSHNKIVSDSYKNWYEITLKDSDSKECMPQK